MIGHTYQELGDQVCGVVGETLWDLVLQLCDLLEAKIFIPGSMGREGLVVFLVLAMAMGTSKWHQGTHPCLQSGLHAFL